MSRHVFSCLMACVLLALAVQSSGAIAVQLRYRVKVQSEKNWCASLCPLQSMEDVAVLGRAFVTGHSKLGSKEKRRFA